MFIFERATETSLFFVFLNKDKSTRLSKKQGEILEDGEQKEGMVTDLADLRK